MTVMNRVRRFFPLSIYDTQYARAIMPSVFALNRFCRLSLQDTDNEPVRDYGHYPQDGRAASGTPIPYRLPRIPTISLTAVARIAYNQSIRTSRNG